MNKVFDINALAHLAKLCFNEDEKTELEAEMKALLSLADGLGEVDTEEISAECALQMKNVFRDDMVENEFTADEMLWNAKTKEDGYITVPKVVGD